MAKQGRTPTGPGAEPSAPDVTAEDSASTTADPTALLAIAERRITAIQDMVADLYGRAFCCEIMNGHRSPNAPTVVKFTNGTSEGTYESVKAAALQILRGDD